MYGEFSAYWRMGIQKRGAWRFHLLLFVPPSFGSVAGLRDFIASSWYEICGKLSEGHLQAGTRVEEVRKWRSATSYMEKYVAKPEVVPEGVETGSVWGVWNEDLLPVQWETVRISLRDIYRIRRIYRRLAKMRGRGCLRCLTVFVQHENVVRLLGQVRSTSSPLVHVHLVARKEPFLRSLCCLRWSPLGSCPH
jgi:hypothetical protein